MSQNNTPSSSGSDLGFLAGGGELGGRIAGYDWASTSLGPVADWPRSLKTTIGLVLRSPVPIVMLWGADGVMIYNDGYSRFAGGRHPGILGSKVLEGWPEVAEFNAHVMKVGLSGNTLAYKDQELTLYRNGVPEQVWMNLDYSPIPDENGTPIGVIAIVVETTSKVKAEQWLQGERERLSQMFQQAPGFMARLTGRDHVFDLANPAYLALVGHRDIVGKPIRAALPELSGQGYFERLDQVFETGEPFIGLEMPVMLRRLPDDESEQRFVDLVYHPLRDDTGSIIGIFAQGTDVTERVLARRAANASEAQFRTFAQVMPNHFWTATPEGRLDWFNDQVYRYSGAGAGDLDENGWVSLVHPDDVPPMTARWRSALQSGTQYETEFRIRRDDGSYRWFLVRAMPVRDEDGSIRRWVGTNTDIEEAKETARALAEWTETLEARVDAEMAERRSAEAALQQAQKMEAIGNLTGGVAHDFNNLLQVLSGNLQLLSRDISGNERAERRVATALTAVARGAKLASQLLAFGRRQPLAPKVLNVGRFVYGMEDMLRRTLGESIEIEVLVSGGLWNTFADPTQIENALLNLCINARDAMEGTGKLTIEAGNAFLDETYARAQPEVVPGQYVVMAVSDTGCGMTPEVMSRVFEPFFSTKPAGKGTGLGLAMVFGFTKQSGGHVKIYSEVGHGTTVKLYLPRTQQTEDVPSTQHFGPVTGGEETILVAEDDEEVRAAVIDMLGGLGYRVLKAKDADSALSIIESGIPIDMLFTDVVMPGTLKSTDLARKARERIPGIAVLFTSGYTENSIVHGGRLDANVELLSKPYTVEALARKIRHVLGNEQQRSAAKTATTAPDTPRPAAPPAPAPEEARSLRVLLVEDEVMIRINSIDVLEELGHQVIEARDAEQALAALEAHPLDVIVTDLGLPGISGADFALMARAMQPEIPIVFATGDSQAPALPGKPGILLRKPYDGDDMQAAIEAATALSGAGQD